MEGYKKLYKQLLYDVTDKMYDFKNYAWVAITKGSLDRRLGFNYGMIAASEELQQLINKYKEYPTMEDYQKQFNELIHELTLKMYFFNNYDWTDTAEGNDDQRSGFDDGMAYAANELRQLINNYTLSPAKDNDILLNYYKGSFQELYDFVKQLRTSLNKDDKDSVSRKKMVDKLDDILERYTINRINQQN